jgi:hypothetical protein
MIFGISRLSILSENGNFRGNPTNRRLRNPLNFSNPFIRQTCKQFYTHGTI